MAASCCRNRLPAQGTNRIHELFEEGFEMFRSGVLQVLPGKVCYNREFYSFLWSVQSAALAQA